MPCEPNEALTLFGANHSTEPTQTKIKNEKMKGFLHEIEGNK